MDVGVMLKHINICVSQLPLLLFFAFILFIANHLPMNSISPPETLNDVDQESNCNHKLEIIFSILLKYLPNNSCSNKTYSR